MNRRLNTIRLIIALLLTLTLASTAPLVGALSWSSDIRLTTDEFWDRSPSITQAVDGSIWVVWSAHRVGLQGEIFYKTSPNYGSDWSSDIQLTTDPAFDDMPSITQTADGSIWVVWASYRSGDYEIFYKTSSDYGSSWSIDMRLTINSSRDVRPSITQDTSGTIWLVWSSNRLGNDEIFSKTSSDYGSSWSTETQLTTDPSWDLDPSITQTADGSIWVVWASYRSGDYEIFYKTSSDYGSTWTSATQLTTDSDFDKRPSIVQDMDGSIWVVWQSDRGGNQQDVYYKTSSDYGSTWSSDTQLTSDNSDDMSPSITSPDDGRIWVVWETDRTGEPEPNFEIFYKFSDVIYVVHDVAITDVTPSATNVTGGETVTISVETENQGTMSETFDVNCYANSTLIGSQAITLDLGTSTTLDFPWITPLSTATYIVSANATTVLDETDTTDNTFTDGTVNVTRPPIQGDVDGDGDVDLDDLYYVMIAYGMTIEDAMATYGVPPGTDIDGDGWIDLDDLYYVLRDFGYP